jgi:hypothetical protein
MALRKLQVWVDEDLIERADKLIARLNQNSNLRAAAGRVTKASVWRLALSRGIEALEEEYPNE